MNIQHRDWKKQVVIERQANDKEYHLSSHKKYQFGMMYRGRFFLQNARGESEAIFRAYALDHALQNLPLSISEDQEFFCGGESYESNELPSGISEMDYACFRAADSGRGNRNFPQGANHTLPYYPMILELGLGGIIGKIEKELSKRRTREKKMYLEAMKIAVNAVRGYIKRASGFCMKNGRSELAERLSRIESAAPQSFADALQLVWLVHVVLESEGRGHNALGRLDQYLYEFYRKDVEKGILDHDTALYYLCHIWTKIEGMHMVTNICIGGLKPDGTDGTNELSYLCLEATKEVKSPSTNLSARFHDGSPEAFHRACFDCIRTGIGFPAIFNDHVCIKALENAGIPTEYARNFCMVGCVEAVIGGQQQAWGDSRFEGQIVLCRALGKIESVSSYDELWKLYCKYQAEDVKKHVDRINAMIASAPASQFPDVLLSALTDDCIGRALDINDGGAIFKRIHGAGFMSLGTVADSLAAVKKLVFEEKKISASELRKALDSDFKDREDIRQMLINGAPKYGNDDDYVDSIAVEIVRQACAEFAKHKTVDGGSFSACFATNINNISAGKITPATPDGRHAWTPLSDAASPYFGRDVHGPTAVISSIGKPDYTNCNCTVVNMRFQPDFFKGESGIASFVSIMKTFVKKRIQELQFNFSDHKLLEKALEQPELYQDLMVRVSGFSAYFTKLEKTIQHDVMRRRAHRV